MNIDPFSFVEERLATTPRQPRNRMKTAFHILICTAWLAVWTFVATHCTSCTTETVTTRTTSAKGHVVETVVVTKKADPAALALAGHVATAYAPPRARRIDNNYPVVGEK